MDKDRYAKKNSIRDRAFKLMKKNPKMCNDNTHKLGRKMFKEKYGFKITLEQIKYITSVDRCRRKVLQDHPELDNRVTSHELAESDRKYYS